MRLFTDWKLIFDASPVWVYGLALAGLVLGLILAYLLWYRSARDISLLADEHDRLLTANRKATEKRLVAERREAQLEREKAREREKRQKKEQRKSEKNARQSPQRQPDEETAKVATTEKTVEPTPSSEPSEEEKASTDAGVVEVGLAAAALSGAAVASEAQKHVEGETETTSTSESEGFFGSGEDDDAIEEEVTAAADTSLAPSVGGTSAKRRVVFIMDVSKSLSEAHLRLSKDELSRAFQSLPEGSLYQLIFFSGAAWFGHQRMILGGERGEDVVIRDHDRSYVWNSGFSGHTYEGGNDHLPTSEWRVFNQENKEATLADIESVGKSYGTTWHLPLTMALNLEPAPRTIYFLTDGDTARQDEVAEEMIALSQTRGRPRIHTISLMEPKASPPLARIAEATGATFTLVIGGGKLLRGEELRDYLAERQIRLA